VLENIRIPTIAEGYTKNKPDVLENVQVWQVQVFSQIYDKLTW